MVRCMVWLVEGKMVSLEIRPLYISGGYTHVTMGLAVYSGYTVKTM